MITLKDIIKNIISDMCGNCRKAIDNGYLCPYSIDCINNYCAADTSLIALDYVERGDI